MATGRTKMMIEVGAEIIKHGEGTSQCSLNHLTFNQVVVGSIKKRESGDKPSSLFVFIGGYIGPMTGVTTRGLLLA
jgi:hypothetical protein